MMGTSSIKGAKGFLMSETSITVYSAILATPIVLGFASRFQFNNIPTWVLLAVLGFVAFIISSQMKGTVKAIIHGVSIGLFLNAFFSTKFGAQLSARLGGLVGSG